MTRAHCKEKILVFGSFGKEIKRQLRMKMRTYVKKRFVTDKGTFYSAQSLTYTSSCEFNFHNYGLKQVSFILFKLPFLEDTLYTCTQL